jgi:hypothetical protein
MVRLLRTTVLLLLLLAVTPAEAKKKTKTKASSGSAARKCAVCSWMVEHLQARAAEEAAKGTSFEMGWRLKDDGTRVAKQVPWAQSELGFGTTIEAACAADDDGDVDTAAPLRSLVQVAQGEEIGLRTADRAADEEAHTLREDPLQLFSSTCVELVFSEEDAFEALRDGWEGKPSAALPEMAQLQKEVCTTRASVCPKARWARWYGPGATSPALIPHVPKPKDEPRPKTKARGGSAAEPGQWWSELQTPTAMLTAGLGAVIGLAIVAALTARGDTTGSGGKSGQGAASAEEVRAAWLRSLESRATEQQAANEKEGDRAAQQPEGEEGGDDPALEQAHEAIGELGAMLLAKRREREAQGKGDL